MRRGRLARALTIATLAGLAARGAAAPGDGSGSGSGDAGGEIDFDGSGSGSAQTPAPATGDAPIVKDPKVAKKWLTAATQLTQKGDQLARQKKDADAKPQYENAVTAYQHAIEASDDLTLYYPMALVEDKLGHDADAYKHLKLVVDPKSALKPDLVKRAQTKLDEVTAKIGTVTLTVTPDGTQITLNGKTIAEAPVAEPLIVDPGAYTFSFAAVGFQPKDVEIKVEPGSETERKIALEPVKVVVKPYSPDDGDKPPEPAQPSPLPIYIGAGATAGLLLTATFTGLAAVSNHNTYTDPKTEKYARLDAQDNGRRYAHITDACLVGAVAAGAFTTYWYFKKWAPEQRASGKDHWLLVGPWVQTGAGGAFATGSF